MTQNQTSRRHFIAGLAGIGATTLIAKAAGAAAQNNGPRRIIDVHHHILPPKFVAQYRKEIAEQGPGSTRCSIGRRRFRSTRWTRRALPRRSSH